MKKATEELLHELKETKAIFDYTYGYQIFDGKKRPKREKLLQLAFGFPLSLDDTNRLLCAGGVNGLYIRCKRDMICI